MSSLFPKRILRETEGAAMVEFALVLTILLLLIMGTLEFGLVWYTKYSLAGAAREGARYGTTYITKSDGSRLAPNAFTPTIQKVVTDYLANLLPTGSCQVQVVNNTAYQTGKMGENLIVQATCPNPWDLLGGFIPQLKNLTLKGQCTMKCE